MSILKAQIVPVLSKYWALLTIRDAALKHFDKMCAYF
jgi:hypothetical protein